MSVRTLSPSANLLRTSRLFSLPSPLPRPINELGNAPNSGSSTATLPYPVQATIETSEKALARGDWGLKRPLPLKSTTKTSAPCVNIDNIDSIDHITDFRSASAYARTLEKWQETDLSISTYTSEVNRSLESVFEPEIDSTARQQSGSTPNERWKFEGPWLGAQTDREFLTYFSRQVKGRRSEFRQYLRRNLPKEKRAQQRRQLREQGEAEEDALTLETATKPISGEQLEIEIKKLRAQPARLEAHVRRFLDLPSEQRDVSTNDVLQPPSTHPSAGLSYQRSHSHTFNHPVHGPQVYKAPVRARVLLPQRDSRGKERRQAVLGVGGVVCNDGELPFWNDSKDNRVAKLDPDIPGGAKAWVSLRKAMVDPEGRIQLVTARADGNNLEPSSISETESYAKKTAKGAPSANGSNDSYGLEELGQPRQSSRATPFKGRNQLLQTISDSLSGGKNTL